MAVSKITQKQTGIGNKIGYSLPVIKEEINKDLQLAMKATMDELLDKLQEMIEEDVYKNPIITHYTKDNNSRGDVWLSYTTNRPNTYIRTYQAKNIFRDSVVRAYNNVYGTIYATDKLKHNKKTNKRLGKHESIDDVNLDVDNFLDILNCGKQHSLSFEVERKPFWNDFIDFCNKNYKSILYKHLAKQGIQQHYIGYTLERSYNLK